VPYNLVLVVVDTLRRDHLSCYGYRHHSSPHIDALAVRGTLFANCVSQAPWTLPAASSIVTSLYPSTHGANTPTSRLPEEAVTLAEILQQRGFATQGFATGYFVGARFGLSQGFDGYDESHDRGRDGVSSYAVTEAAIEWLRTRSRAPEPRPFFLFLHYYDPHYNWGYDAKHAFGAESTDGIRSYIPIEEIRRLSSSGRLLPEDLECLDGYYAGEIHVVDEAVGQLMTALTDLDLDGATAIVFTADHGEEFGEHASIDGTAAFGHTFTNCGHVLDVPMILSGPGMPRGVVIRPTVGTVDIVPTVLGWLGIPYQGSLQGRDLMPAIRGDMPDPNRRPSVISETWNRVGRKSVQNDRWRLSVLMAESSCCVSEDERANLAQEPRLELFDLHSDPEERHNVASDHPEVVEELLRDLRRQLEMIDAVRLPRQSWVPSADEIEMLQTLGYAE
jgi:arylsulfatase A-like enzyme